MNRETTTFKTPGGHTIEHYTYLTGKEARILQSDLLSHAKVEAGADGKQVNSMTGDAMITTQAKAIEILCVSFNSNKEGVAEAIDNLPVTDYNAIVKALNSIVVPVFSDDFLGKPSTPASA